MCEFRIDADRLRARFGSDADFALAKAAMVVMHDEDELFEVDEAGFRLTERGRPFVRTIASCLEDYLRDNVSRFSAAI